MSEGSGRMQLEHVTPPAAAEAARANAEALRHCAVRLLCVLALDRFGDFTSEQVSLGWAAQCRLLGLAPPLICLTRLLPCIAPSRLTQHLHQRLQVTQYCCI